MATRRNKSTLGNFSETSEAAFLSGTAGVDDAIGARPAQPSFIAAPPTAVPDTNTAIEDGAIVTGNVGANDSDPDPDTLTYSLNTPVAGLTLNGNGDYFFNPLNAAYQHIAFGATQTVIANYTVNDGNGGTATSTLTITVTGVNDAPIAADDVNNATEDGSSISGTVATDDIDVDDGAVLSYAFTGTLPAGLTPGVNGAYTFNPGDAAYQHIAQGATQIVVATYTVTDQHSASDTGTLTITITGTNDAPVAVADTEAVDEDAAPITGNVGSNDTDVDDGATRTFAAVGTVPAGLTFNPDGSYSFDPSDAAYQSLATGITQDVVLTYTITDQFGASDTETLTITVTGTNDAAVLSADTRNLTETDSAVNISSSGTLTISDVDSPATFVAQTNSVGTYGTFSVDSAGAWTYTASSAHNEFVDGQVYTDTFSVESADGTMTSVTINITGTNDAAVLSADVRNLTETDSAVNISSSGTLTISDVDSPATFDAQAGTVGTYGTFAIDAAGAWTYTASSAHDEFVDGQVYTDTFSVTSDDGTSTSVTINITGTNDAAVLSADVRNLTETDSAVNISSSGTLTISDVDSPATFVAQTNSVGTYGTFSVDSAGAWTYTASSAHNEFVDGQVYTDTFSVESADGTMTSVTINITGTNDAAVLSADVRNLTETDSAVNISSSGTLTISDVDSPATFDAQAGTVGTYGTFAIDAAGAWTYTASSAHDEFVDGQVYTDTFSVTSDDGTSTSVTINITGTNDAAVLSADVRNLTETDSAVNISSSGTLTISDVDSPATFDAQAGTVGTYGTFAIDAAGAWTYTASSAHDEFVDGQVYTDTFSVESADGTSTSVTINITGTNDAPVANDDTLAATEDTPVTYAAADLIGNDTDAELDTLVIASVSNATGGTAVLNGNGTVTFTPTLNFNGVAGFDYVVSDGNGGTDTGHATVNVAAVNDAPTATITPPGGAGVAWDQSALDTSTGRNISAFVQAENFTLTGATTLRSVTFFLSDSPNSVEGVLNGFSGTLSFAIYQDNGSGLPGTLILSGTDFAPVLTDSGLNSAFGGDIFAGVVNLGAVSLSAGQYWIAFHEGAWQSAFDGTDVFVLQSSNDTTGIGRANTTNETNPNGTFAAMVEPLAFALSGGGFQATEQVALSLKNTMSVADVDAGAGTVTVTLSVGYGVLHLEAGTSGATVSNNDSASVTIAGTVAQINALLGSDATSVVTYTADTDAPPASTTLTLLVNDNGNTGSGGSLTGSDSETIYITAVNDAPTAVADTDTASEAGVNPGNTPFAGDPSATGNVLTNDTDPDSGDTKTVTAIAGGTVGSPRAGTYGSVTINANGSYTYTLNNDDSDTNALAQDEVVTDVFTYTMEDSEGVTSSTTLTITITGTNDAPVAVADVNGADAVTESGVNPMNTPFPGDPSASGNVLTNDTDVDAGDTKTVSGVTGGSVGSAVTGTYGSVVIDANGDWTYSLDNTDPQTQALAQGQVVTDTFTYTVQDTNGATSSTTLTITITGTNDAPDAVNDTATATEDGPILTGSVATNDSDVDTGATLSYALDAPVSGLSLSGNGGYIFNTLDPAYQSLRVGATATVTATYTVTDQHGATDTATLTITVQGTNDAPVANDDTATATEDGAIITGNVADDDTDVDTGPATGSDTGVASFALVSPVAGLTMAADGSYSFDPSSYDYIGAGTTDTINAQYTMTDGAGATDTATLVITVNGVNDAPVAADDTLAVAEDDGIVTGSVSTNDDDIDNNDPNSSLVFTTGPLPTGFTAFGADGSYSFNSSDASFQSLGLGQSQSVVLNYTVSDGMASDTATLTVTVNGTNDAAVITGDTSGSVIEAGGVLNGTAGTPTDTGDLDHTDVDDNNDDDVWQTVAAGTASNGGYGTYEVDAAGVWTYTLDNDDTAVQGLNDGDSLTDTVTVTAEDGTTETVTITINGTNDAAVITGDTSGSVTEAGGVLNGTAGTPTATGNLDSTDVDNTADAWTPATGAGANGYGSYSVDASGAWSYTLDNDDTAVQGLNVGDSLTDTFTVSTVDGTTETVTITINGTNDAAVITGDDTGSVTEAGGVLNGTAGTPTATGDLDHTDVDDNNDDDIWQTVPAGTASNAGYGTYEVTASGGWTYTLDNDDSAVQGLNAGDSLTDTVTVTAEDGTTETVTITINGTNDAAVITGTTTGSVTEASGVANATPGTPQATGNLDADDVDNPDDSWTAASGARTYGSYTLGADGAWTYTLDDNNAAVQALNTGGTLTDTFTAVTVDGTQQVVTITINGANDAAVITGDTTGALTETDVAQSVAGDLNATDVDNPATFNELTTNGAYGTFNIFADGTWNYAMSSPHDEFAAGQNYVDSFTVSTVDGTTEVVTVTITGSADDSPVAVDDTDTAIEGGLIVTGNVGDNDTDGDTAPGGLTYAAVGPLPAGLSFNADGSYSFDPTNPAYDYLAAGEPHDVTIDYTVGDGESSDTGTLTITITGTNDAAVITGDTTGSASETNAPVTITGNLDTDDVDGADVFVAQTGTAGSYGTFSIDDTGAWSYVASGAHDELPAGSSYSDTFTVSSADGTTQSVTVTINGTNDAAVITGDTSGSANETNAPVTITGNLDTDDVDGADVFVVQSTTYGAHGAFSIDATGAWSYVANAAFDELPAGSSYSDTFTVSSADGTTQSVTVTINGTNDAAVITGETSGSADETDAPVTITGDLDVSDVDGDDVFVAQTGTPGTYGTFSIDATGAWSYTASSAHNDLAVGQSHVDTFTVAADDGTTEVVTVTINGTNDAAVITGETSGSADETDAPVTITGDLDVSDVDGDDVFVAQTGTPGTYGTFSIDAGGSWSYLANSAFDELPAGSSYVDTFTVASADGTTQSVTVTINGTNDAAVITGDTSGSASETNAPVTITGDLDVTDVDGDDTFVAQLGTAGTYGTFSIDAGGSWSYLANSAFDELPAGSSYVDTFTVASADGTTQSVTVTVNGTNDAAVITGDTSGSASETNAPVTITGDLDVTDVDGDDTFVAQLGTAGTYGTFSIDAGGSWSYLANSAFDELPAGSSYVDTFTVASADGTTQSVTVTINGTNDAPIANDDTASATEDGAVVTGTVATNDSDVDVGDTRTYTLNAPVAGLTLDSNGSYSFDPSSYDSLALGVTQNVVATYTLTDGQGASDTATLTITVTGVNDAPDAVNDTASATEDGAVVTGTVATNDSDVDSGDTRTYTLNAPVAGLTLLTDGSYSFDPSSYDSLAFGVTQNVVATYTLTDGQGATDTATLTVTVTGINDAPDAVNDTASATEDGPIVTGTVATNDTDVDVGDTRTYTLLGPVTGLILHSNGSYSFDPSSYDSIAAGNTITLSTNYRVTDGQGATDTATLTITVTGVNDAPVAGDDVASATEDGAIVNGTVVINDSDVDSGDTRTYTLNAPVAGLTLDTDGNYSFDPSSYDSLAFGVTQNVVATYTLTDGQGATDTATLTVTVTGINDAPDAVNDTASATEDGPMVTGTVATNDTDVDVGDTRTYTLNAPVAGLTLDSSGSYSFDPSSYDSLAFGATQNVVATYTLTDGQGATDTATLTITVTGVNDAPDAVNDIASATEDGAVVTGTVATNDTDVDVGDTRTYTLNAPVAGLTLDSSGSYSFDPSSYDSLAFGATQLVVATYTLTDGQGATDTATLTITVTGVNDGPDAVNDVASATEDGAVVTGTVATNDTDVDAGDTRTYTLNAPVAGLTLDSNGSYVFDPSSYDSLAAGAIQNVVATYTLTDGQGATDTATLTITVTGTNDAPVAHDDSASATEDGPLVTGSVATNDSDVDAGDSRSYALVGTTPGLTMATDGSYSFDPSHAAYQSLAEGASVAVVATYSLTDGEGASDTETLTITVTGVNDAPVAGDDTRDVNEDGGFITGNVGSNDTDVDVGATRTFAAVGPAPAGLTFNPDGSYSFDPSNAVYQSLAAGVTQAVVLTYTITDGEGASDTATLTITVTGTNDAPVANDDANSATEDGGTVTGTVATNDNDVDIGDSRDYALVGTTPGLTMALDGSYSFDPSSYDSVAAGTTQLVVATYTVTDDQGATDTATLTIAVAGVNDAPVANDDTASATEDSAVVTGSVGSNDSDVDAGSTRTYTLNAPVAGLTLLANGSYVFDPANAAYQSLAAGATQTVVATYNVTDGQGGSDTATLTITVTGVNDAPVANDDTNGATEDGAIVTGNVGSNDSDVDNGATRTYALVGTVPGLTLNGNGTYSFDASNAAYQSLAAGATQLVVATYTVTDDQGATDTATLTITVAGVDDPAVARPDAFITVENAVLSGSVFPDNGSGADSDVDGPTLQVGAVNGSAANVGMQITLASGALLTLNANGTFSYNPNGAFNALPDFAGSGASNTTGTDSFTYALVNGNTVTVTLTVRGADSNGDVLVGTAGDDTLNGGVGADSMTGLGGNDAYLVDNSGDLIIEAVGGGTDIVYTTIGYTLGAGQEIEILSTASQVGTGAFILVGNEFNQTLYGNAGANYLDGGSGNDTLVGFGGDDSYVVDGNEDYVAEFAGGGTDIVYVRGSFQLGASQEVEFLLAFSQADNAAITIVGNNLAQRIFGNAGNNYLDGGGAADLLVGFGGNDTYLVDDALDYVAEVAGEGSDIVYALASFTLTAGQHIEILSAISQAGTIALNLSGNEFANIIYANEGANVLNGGGGNDFLQGFGGADSFQFTTALGAGNVDTIADFLSGTDKLALDDAIFSGIGAPGSFNAAAFVTGAAATTAAHRIVYNQATGQMFYDADGNGAGAAVLFATFSGNPVLVASDFQVI